MNTPNLDALIAQATQGPWEYCLDLADTGEKSTDITGNTIHLYEPVCIIPHDDLTEDGYAEVRANARLIRLFGTHGSAMVAALNEIHALSSPSEGRVTFDPIGWNLRIHQIVTDILTALDQEAKG